jgi:stage V sporulation protein SpoVS
MTTISNETLNAVVETVAASARKLHVSYVSISRAVAIFTVTVEADHTDPEGATIAASRAIRTIDAMRVSRSYLTADGVDYVCCFV